MVSSPVALSISTVLCLFGFSLILLAGLSDNWIEYQVDRKEYGRLLSKRGEINEQTTNEYRTNPLYFSRNYGLIHICFPEEVPSEIGSYTKFASVCITNGDYLPDIASIDNNSVLTLRLWFMRSMLLMYLIGIFFCALSLLLGIVGCYKRSANLIAATGVVLFLGVLSLFTSLMLWHVVGYYERKVLTVSPFYLSWNPVLKQVTRISYGWSYVVNIIGIVILLIAAISLLYSKCAINREEDVFNGKNSAYFQQYYGMGNNSEKSLVPSNGFAYGGVTAAPYGHYGGSLYGIYGPPSGYGGYGYGGQQYGGYYGYY